MLKISGDSRLNREGWQLCIRNVYIHNTWYISGMFMFISGVGNAAAAAALAAAPFRPKWCGKAISEPYISAEVGKGSTTPVIE